MKKHLQNRLGSWPKFTLLAGAALLFPVGLAGGLYFSLDHPADRTTFLPLLVLGCLVLWLLFGMAAWSYALLLRVKDLRDRTMEEIETLTAMLGHAMKTPLQRLQLDLDAAKVALSKDGNVQSRLENIQFETTTLGHLSRNVLGLFMLRELSPAVELPELVLSSTVELAVERCRLLAETRDGTLSFTNEIGERPVRHHPELLLVAVEQLLSNVFEHSGTYSATLRLFAEGEEVLLEVKDQGEGIDAEFLDFFHTSIGGGKPLARARASLKGLGLETVRRIALFHRGTLALANDPQGGAIAVLRFPVKTNGM